jgi:hypothetical protein
MHPKFSPLLLASTFWFFGPFFEEAGREIPLGKRYPRAAGAERYVSGMWEQWRGHLGPIQIKDKVLELHLPEQSDCKGPTDRESGSWGASSFAFLLDGFAFLKKIWIVQMFEAAKSQSSLSAALSLHNGKLEPEAVQSLTFLLGEM